MTSTRLAFDSGERLGGIGEQHHAVGRHTCLGQPLDLGRAVLGARPSHRIFSQVIETVETFRISLERGKAIAGPGHRICEGNRLASFRADVHAGADDVEAVGVDAGDQGVELDDLGLHVLEPKRFESGEDHVRHGANQLAVGLDIAVRLFIRDPHRNRARLLDPVNRRVGPRK